jgi:GxxExxY protein
MDENAISKHIVESAIEVHRTLESVYAEALCWELQHSGLIVEREVLTPILYKENVLKTPLKVDLLINRLVIIEVKAVTIYNPIFESQALTYLRLLNLKLALVINFGAKLAKDGIHRVVNGL